MPVLSVPCAVQGFLVWAERLTFMVMNRTFLITSLYLTGILPRGQSRRARRVIIREPKTSFL